MTSRVPGKLRTRISKAFGLFPQTKEKSNRFTKEGGGERQGGFKRGVGGTTLSEESSQRRGGEN